MTTTIRSRKAPSYPFQIGEEVQINSSCFVPEWIGTYATVKRFGDWVPGIGLEVIVQTTDLRVLTVVATSLSPAN